MGLELVWGGLVQCEQGTYLFESAQVYRVCSFLISSLYFAMRKRDQACNNLMEQFLTELRGKNMYLLLHVIFYG